MPRPRPELNRAPREIGFWSALTPALSPEERENRSPRFDESGVTGCRAVLAANGREADEASGTLECSKEVRWPFPLLGGEGQGEGERSSDFPARRCFEFRMNRPWPKLNRAPFVPIPLGFRLAPNCLLRPAGSG